MINVTVLFTVILVALALLIGVSILLYQHYRFRRKSIDWGPITRYDTPLELPPGSNNSSFRSYKYSQLVGIKEGRKNSNSHLYPPQRPSLSLGDIEKDAKTRGNRSSTKSCPPGVVYTVPTQEFRVNKEQQLVQPYYYYRQVIVPAVSTKARHSLPEVIPSSTISRNSTSPNHSNNLTPSPQAQRQLRNPYSTFQRKSVYAQPTSERKHKLSVDYCIEHVPLLPSPYGTKTSNLTLRQSQRRQLPKKPTALNPPEEIAQVPGEDVGFETEEDDSYFRQPPGFPYNRTSPIQRQQYQAPPPPGQRRYSHTYFQVPVTQTCHPQLQFQEERFQEQDFLVCAEGRNIEMLTHQSRSLPTGPPIPGARLNRTYSISSQGHIESAVRKGHRGSSPAIRTYNPEGFSFDVSSPPESPPPVYHGSRSPSPLYVRAASLDINRGGGSPCPTPLGESNFHISGATQHSSHSMDSYPSGRAPMLSPNSLCVRRASRCLSPLYIPPISPKSPTDGNSSSSQPSASSTGPLSPMLGSLQLDLYLKKDVTIYLDSLHRITKLSTGENSGSGKKENDSGGSFPFPSTGNGMKPGALGRLHFRLKYDLDKSDLNLHVIEAHGLIKGEKGGFNDPYIRVFLSPEVDTRKRETSVHRNETDPFFDDNFKFPVSQEEMKERNLVLQVFDNDKYARHDIVGEVCFALEDFDITTNLEVWADIVQNKKPSGEKQEILISLSYLPSAERLTVVLLKARNLQSPENKDMKDQKGSLPNPFVKVYLLGGGRRQKKKKTTARKNSKNPVWNEAFTFSLSSSSLPNCSIEISVLDQSNDLIGSHALIGSCMLGPHQMGSELRHWTEMTQNLRQTITMWHVLT